MRSGVEEYIYIYNGEDGDFFLLIRSLIVYPWLYLLLPLIFCHVPLKIQILGPLDEASLLFLRIDFLTT
jgi:hypothetical protein